MAVKRQDLENLVYRTKRIGKPVVEDANLNVTEAEKNSANTIVSNFLSYVLAKHS